MLLAVHLLELWFYFLVNVSGYVKYAKAQEGSRYFFRRDVEEARNDNGEAFVFKSALASATITRTGRDDSSEVAEDLGRNWRNDTKRHCIEAGC
jgi:hypothetical protein